MAPEAELEDAVHALQGRMDRHFRNVYWLLATLWATFLGLAWSVLS